MFALAFVLYTLLLGLPYTEDEILLWLTAALFVASLSDLGQWRRGLVRDWLPLYVVLAVYALLRGYASHVLWGPFFDHKWPSTRSSAVDNHRRSRSNGGSSAPTTFVHGTTWRGSPT